MSAKKSKFEVKPALVAALLLDGKVMDASQEAKLSALCDRLFARGAAHVTVIGGGQTHPDKWQMPKALRLERTDEISIGRLAHHYSGGELGLTLLPEASGRLLVLAAARLLMMDPGTAAISVSKLEDAIKAIAGPSPDLVIVTGGAMHLGAGMTWQAGYAELVFFKQSWSALSQADLDRGLDDFAARSRRFGGLTAAGVQ